MKQWMAIVAAFILLTACSKTNTMSKEPKIKLEGVSNREVKQGSSEESLRIYIGVTDGDANVYNDGETPCIFLKDSRYPAKGVQGYIPPAIDQVFMDPAYGFTGTYYVDLPAAFLTFKDTLNNRQRDTLEYEIYIKDQAGNESNRIVTGEIYLLK